MKVLILESSTSAAKAMVYDSREGVVSAETQPYGKAAVGDDGTQDTRAVFDATVQVANRVSAGHSIGALAVCSTWHSMVVLDTDMRPKTRTYTWAYLGTAQLCKRMRCNEELADTLYVRTGCMPHVTYMRQVLLLLREQGMKLDDKRFASQGAYTFYRLTGKFLESRCTVSGSGLLNIHTGEYDPFVLSMLGIKPEQLGGLTDYRQTIPLSDEGAALLGLTQGMPVIPAHPDGALNQVGNNASLPGVMTLSVGTSAALRLAVKAPVLPAGHQTWCYNGVEDWLSGAAVAGACNCINWFKDVFLEGKWGFAELECEADAGRDIPVFLPFLFGERCPGWDDARSGGFMDLRGTHTVRDMYRGLQMGILFGLRQCYDALTQTTGPAEKIVMSGGILQSAQWSRMAANIFGQPIYRSGTSQASLLGGAVLALRAAGVVERIGRLFPDTPELPAIEPGGESAEYCQRQYERFQYWYDKTKTNKGISI